MKKIYPEPTQPSTLTSKHRRNATTTRQAILDSARILFTQKGYSDVGVREIAENAGVTAMLVNRYFGSKEKLFEVVITETLSKPGVLRSSLGDSEHSHDLTAKSMATKLLETSNPSNNADGILILLRSAGNAQAAKILQNVAIRDLNPLCSLFEGKNSEVRAALCIALISGFKLMRQVISLPSLTDPAPCIIEDQVALLFKILISKQ